MILKKWMVLVFIDHRCSLIAVVNVFDGEII